MIPDEIPNLIGGDARPPASDEWIDKLPPGRRHAALPGGALRRGRRRRGSRGRPARTAGVGRTDAGRAGDVVREIALALRDRREEISALVAEETGKPMELALGETDAAIEMGFFVAGEGRRSYGRTMPASMPHRAVSTVRRPVGRRRADRVVQHAAAQPRLEGVPGRALRQRGRLQAVRARRRPPPTHFATVCSEAGLPPGVLNVVQGLGQEAGCRARRAPRRRPRQLHRALRRRGASVNEAAARRLAKVCLELGGKNALVVCDDADLDNAVRWALASAFSNAGQRCAAASRIIVFDARLRRVPRAVRRGRAGARAATRDQRGGARAAARGDSRLVGDGAGRRRRVSTGPAGFSPPTILEGVAPDAEISCTELFGPVAILYRAAGFEEAVALVNDSPYGLTAAIHTASVHRAMRFAELARAGVVVVNGGTHGSEPHMGFGGVKRSGTGWKEAGVEALDVYSDVVYVNVVTDPAKV